MHQRGPDGSLKPQPAERQSARKSFSGGGGIYSTGPDYLTLIRMLLHGGALDGVRILRPDTVALMGQNHIGNIEAGVMKTAAPALSNDVDFFPGISLKWGFGHMINMQAVPDGRSAGSLTWAGLFNTYYWIDPEQAHRRRFHDAGAAVRRSARIAHLPPIRARCLRSCESRLLVRSLG